MNISGRGRGRVSSVAPCQSLVLRAQPENLASAAPGTLDIPWPRSVGCPTMAVVCCSLCSGSKSDNIERDHGRIAG